MVAGGINFESPAPMTSFGQMRDGDLPQTDPQDMLSCQRESRNLLKFLKGAEMQESQHKPKRSKFVKVESSKLRELCSECDDGNNVAQTILKSVKRIPDKMRVAILREHAERIGWSEDDDPDKSSEDTDIDGDDTETESTDDVRGVSSSKSGVKITTNQ